MIVIDSPAKVDFPPRTDSKAPPPGRNVRRGKLQPSARPYVASGRQDLSQVLSPADAVKIIFFFETQPFSIFKSVSEYYSVNINTGAQKMYFPIKLALKRWQRYRIFIRQSRKDARINMVSCQMILHWNDQNVKFSISPKLYHWGLLHRLVSIYIC